MFNKYTINQCDYVMCPGVVLLLHKRNMHTCKDLSNYYHSGKDVVQQQP